MRVLAFDASSTTGWASFADARSAPVLGHFEIEASTNYGFVAKRMVEQANGLVDEHQPDVVAFEAPIFLPRDRWHTRRLLTSLVIAIELVAECHQKRCIEISPSDVKRALGGSKASKGKQMGAAIMMGWPVKNDHEADACGVALATYGFLRTEQWRRVHA
jgi:Holliday junction resolvasome RuvABC endonuclease subunit